MNVILCEKIRIVIVKRKALNAPWENILYHYPTRIP